MLASWVAQGAPAPPAAALPAPRAERGRELGAFLNGDSLKERIVAPLPLRALVRRAPVLRRASRPGPFFEIVRSRTAPGQPIDEIATVRPYDDPGASASGTACGRSTRRSCTRRTSCMRSGRREARAPARAVPRQRLAADATSRATRPRWRRTRSSPSPQIPARSRYQYLLDDAQYFVMTFIRGPVCRGQVAVDVIEDQFWVSFLDPDHDPRSPIPDFLAKTRSCSSLPAEHAERFRPRRALARVRPQAAQVPGGARALLRRDRPEAPRPDARLDLGRRRPNPQRAAHRVPQLRQRRRS